jgi:hypothetical protein
VSRRFGPCETGGIARQVVVRLDGIEQRTVLGGAVRPSVLTVG